MDTLTLVPVFNYMNPTFADDIHQQGCNYAKQSYNFYHKDPNSFTKEADIAIPVLREKLTSAFDLNNTQVESMDYVKFFYLADALIGETFEGMPDIRTELSLFERALVHQTQKVILSRAFDSFALPLYMTKFMRLPLATMLQRKYDMENGRDIKEQVKYMLYSAHDT